MFIAPLAAASKLFIERLQLYVVNKMPAKRAVCTIGNSFRPDPSISLDSTFKSNLKSESYIFFYFS